ncbi:hypothetical protein AB0878_19630 [Amycolatopsis sp. NPDC047767]|uniref:hypothetical protein n=1 Tax=Amycolatopsis sp. NPDC047767 TaxID=3156765 RepID=UPI003456D80E
MNRDELVRALAEEGVAQNSYSINDGYADEQYVMERRGSRWCVSYAERGKRIGEQCFESEEEAYLRLFEMVVGDATTRG